MRRYRSLWILIFCSLVWIFLCFCFTDIASYLLSWASSVKDESQPALPKPELIRSNTANSFTIYDISKENKFKKDLNKKLANNHQRYNEQTVLKRFSNDFKTDWCRIHQANIDWKNFLAPCYKHTKWMIKNKGWKNKMLRTSAAKSFISKWDIRPAGEFSRFFIQSKTTSNHTKKIGGDSWRIHIRGTSSVSATVFDHNNGSYEVLFLLMEAGFYQIEISLDYTLCDGFKDPPVDWYKKGTHFTPDFYSLCFLYH